MNMSLAQAIILDLYGFIDSMEVHLSQYPRRAVATFSLEDNKHTLALDNPLSLEPLMYLLNGCWNIQITDRNIAEGNCLNYGRYRLGIGGEDGPVVEVLIDSFEHTIDV